MCVTSARAGMRTWSRLSGLRGLEGGACTMDHLANASGIFRQRYKGYAKLYALDP